MLLKSGALFVHRMLLELTQLAVAGPSSMMAAVGVAVPLLVRAVLSLRNAA
jgi:hypothetical protein